MGLFGRKAQDAPDQLAVDPSAGDETVRAAAAAARRGDWPYVRDVLSATTNPDITSFYVGIITDVDGPQPWIEQWALAEPRSGLAQLVWGAHGIHWAWEARTTARAAKVSRERFELFFDRLRSAENHLDEATELAHDDPTPWAFLITCAMGRQLGVPEAMRRFKEATARDPYNHRAHHRMQRMLCKQWSGSYEQMHAFADQAVANMPAGCPLGDLVAEAQYEQWLWLPEGEDAAYVGRPDVAATLLAAADKSVRHPRYPTHPAYVQGRSHFALGFVNTGQWAAAAQQFAALGDRVTADPWSAFNGPVAAFRSYRKDAYAKAGMS